MFSLGDEPHEAYGEATRQPCSGTNLVPEDRRNGRVRSLVPRVPSARLWGGGCQHCSARTRLLFCTPCCSTCSSSLLLPPTLFPPTHPAPFSPPGDPPCPWAPSQVGHQCSGNHVPLSWHRPAPPSSESFIQVPTLSLRTDLTPWDSS